MLKVIVCVDKNNAIGKEGELGFRLPYDLRNFRALTEGNVVVYGRKSLPSMGNKPLPNRTNIIMSNDKEWLYEMVGKHDEVMYAGFKNVVAMSVIADVYICGGGEIYKKFMEDFGGCVDEYIITTVDGEIPNADTFFPMELFKKEDFELYARMELDEELEGVPNYTIARYVRKQCTGDCVCNV